MALARLVLLVIYFPRFQHLCGSLTLLSFVVFLVAKWEGVSNSRNLLPRPSPIFLRPSRATLQLRAFSILSRFLSRAAVTDAFSILSHPICIHALPHLQTHFTDGLQLTHPIAFMGVQLLGLHPRATES